MPRLLWSLPLLAIAAGVGLVTWSANMPVSPFAYQLLFGGGGLVLAALVALLVMWRVARRRAYAEALTATEVIARWQVYPADMAAFREKDAARAARRWSMKNWLKLPRHVPPEGFPIIVGETWLLVGSRLHRFGLKEFGVPGEVAWHEGPPPFIEINNSIPMQTGVCNIIVVRIPVPAAAREQGGRALRHFQAQVTPHEHARLRRHFINHFEAVDQTVDEPHWQQRRRKPVFILIALFCLAMLAIIFLPRLL